ncbi:superoxide dismutase family protein [Sulfitobacter sp. BDSS02]|nr:superoxide dismutase family protein [Sulfitobacter sp. BDSS02]MBR9850840.1 superoxide dismutase family protein [Paracoccaceae bacterium]
MKSIFVSVIAVGMMGSAAQAAEVVADVMGADGQSHGTVTVTDTESGMAHAVLELTGLPEGTVAVHLHETGDCSADDFSSAGGHIAGDADHGIDSAAGPHPGDLPNLHVSADGSGMVEHFLPEFDVETYLLDDDGSAFVIHAGTDDYTSQPSGDAGDRIACGVFEHRGE